MSQSINPQDAWVSRVLGITVIRANAAPADQVSDDDPLDLKNRLALAAQQMAQLQKANDPAIAELVGAQAAAKRAIDERSPKAGDMMDLLERQLSQARQAAQFRENSDQFAGKVAYAQLLLRWHKAQDAVLTNISQLGAVLSTHPEVMADEDTDELLDLIDEFGSFVPDFGRELDDVLDEARKPDADIPELHREAMAVLGQYRAQLARIDELKELESLAKNAGAGSMALGRELEDALDEIEIALRQIG